MTEGVCVLGGVGGCYPPSHQHVFPHLHFWIKHAPRTYAEIPWWGPRTSPAKRDDPSAISQDFFLLCCQERGYQRRFHPNAGGELSSSSRLLLDLGLLASSSSECHKMSVAVQKTIFIVCCLISRQMLLC